jgi:hypothetical protein
MMVYISLRDLEPNAGTIKQSEFIYKQIEYLRMIHDADARGVRIENMSEEHVEQIRALDFSHLGLAVRRGKDGIPVLVVS